MQKKNKNYLGKKTIVSLGLALSMFSGFSTSALAAPVSTATVNKGVNFRADQSTSAPVWGFIKQGTLLSVEAANDYWVLVNYGGKKGYVSRNYVTVHENKPAPSQPAPGGSLGSKIINTASSFKGRVTYVFGSRDLQRLRLDCSSFTQYVFQLNGIQIPWGSKAQAKVGTYIPRNQLQPGDLVFFSVNTPDQINHVGIYIGNGQFINNLPNKGVVVDNFNSSYWTSHYITGRRI
ncbi:MULTISPECIES: C40 family peptidase [unclassified Paenibacillus]|uniref:C40 family peptidase n=1 Tax=unclassified Paenibacillus TaxID=185978 RepID=UPI002783A183|nr:MULTISPECIES: SH3 domain-containing C40 family peptidase [unclassified Paenibacillus]MDQ0898818.1 cell wall-associated NlpC family hydrolase [Paenibacillus sp. V4I7]MDQ0915193.1 cell wall-associated NlpC family hydrolase [Paenibacillus sp. V4I5]